MYQVLNSNQELLAQFATEAEAQALADNLCSKCGVFAFVYYSTN